MAVKIVHAAGTHTLTILEFGRNMKLQGMCQCGYATRGSYSTTAIKRMHRTHIHLLTGFNTDYDELSRKA